MGDAIVGDEIFGIGSSREQAVSTLLGCGVRAVLSPRFGRTFYRNCWNLGLPALEIDTDGLRDLDEIGLDLVHGVARAGDSIRRFGARAEGSCSSGPVRVAVAMGRATV